MLLFPFVDRDLLTCVLMICWFDSDYFPSVADCCDDSNNASPAGECFDWDFPEYSPLDHFWLGEPDFADG